MILQSIFFTENEDGIQEWILEGLTLDKINLLVGKNATGKTRTLNVISALAYFLLRLRPIVGSSRYECQFNHQNNIYKYSILFRDDNVVLERLLINDDVYLERGEGGIGKIRAEKMGNDYLDFQSPTNELAVATRRDSIQHSFLEPLHEWASSLRHYHFGSELGKGRFTVFTPSGQKVDERDENAVVGIFRDGVKEFNDDFVKALIDDMAAIDYHIEKIEIAPPISIKFMDVIGEPVGLCVKERDLPGLTDQSTMSQGMYRVLSLLIHTNYFQLKKSASCVLVDDIGEGLDFERSCLLIDLLRNKADNYNIQVILSSNDRFIMNRVPLEEWSVLQRKANRVYVRNHKNSRKKFEDFKFTGLSNFSFLEMDIINQPDEVH